MDIEKLHRVMGHIAPDAAKTMVAKGTVEGLKRKAVSKVREAPRPSNIGDEVHTDVWGQSPVQTLGGKGYYAGYTDGHSYFSRAYLMRLKSETFAAYKRYEAEHLHKSGTLRNLTVHDTPEHNGIAERLNRTLLEKVRAMLHASQLPKFQVIGWENTV